MSYNEILNNEDFLNIQGDYVHLFKDAKNYSREILKEIIKMNSAEKFSLESLTELEGKLDILNAENKDNPYIYRDEEITLEYTIHDMKYFLGKNKKSKENIIAFCQVYLDKINAEEKLLILSADDLLKSLEELNQIKKEVPMGKTTKKETKKKETQVSEDVNTSEALNEETVKAENTKIEGDNMKNDNITGTENIHNFMGGIRGEETVVEKSEAKSETKEAKSETKSSLGGYLLKGGAILTGIALLAGAGYWAFKNYVSGEATTDSAE